MNRTWTGRLPLLSLLLPAALLVSSPAPARDMSSTLAPAVNGLDQMQRDLCHSLKLKCKTSQGPRKTMGRNATTAPATGKPAVTKPPPRGTAAAKPTPKPVTVPAVARPTPKPVPLPAPVPTPRPMDPPAQVASAETAPDQPAVPLPRVRPAPEPDATSAAKVVVTAPAPDAAPANVPPPATPQDKVASIAPPTATTSEAGECERGLRASKVQFEAVAAPFGDANCPVDDPVRLHAIETPSGMVSFPEGPVFSCRFARQFAMWISDTGSAVVLAQTNKRLEKVATGPGYDCRHRNGDSSGKMSEHAAGDAVDITTLTLAGGSTIRIADAIDPASPSFGVLRALRTTACGYFTTVLGPGANEAHKEHYHLDLGVHGKSGNYRICE